MNRLFDILTHNLGWKIVSLVAAVVLWFVIVNINNPTKDRVYTVMLAVEGEDALRENNTVLLNEDELKSTHVQIRVRGSVMNLADSSLKDSLYALIDLTPIDISWSSDFGERLPIRVKYGKTSDSFDILSCTPEEVSVVLDRYVRRVIPLTVQKADEDKEGYISLEPVASPAAITVSGPKSYVDMIAEVKATVEVGEATEGFEVRKPIEVLNADGRDISQRFELSASEADIYVGVETYAKIPVSMPVTIGQPAAGYRITSVTVSPREIEVEGNSADIQALNAIRLVDIDVTGISRTKVETYDIRAYLEDTALNIREGSDSRVRVTVTVEREITKEISVPIEELEVRGQAADIVLPTGEVLVEVQGLAAEIVSFEESLFTGYIDVTGLEPGVHELEVRLEPPDGIVQTASETVEVEIGEYWPTDEAEPEPEPEP